MSTTTWPDVALIAALFLGAAAIIWAGQPMSATDTRDPRSAPSGGAAADTWPLEEVTTAERVRALVESHGLPIPRWAGRGYGTAVLRAAGPWPLDDLLAWAGEMSRDPHWWVLRHGDGTADVHAAGYVHGLAVSIAAATRQRLPDRLQTDDVIAAAAAERCGLCSTPPRLGCRCARCMAIKSGAPVERGDAPPAPS